MFDDYKRLDDVCFSLNSRLKHNNVQDEEVNPHVHETGAKHKND